MQENFFLQTIFLIIGCITILALTADIKKAPQNQNIDQYQKEIEAQNYHLMF